jgi:hypothetical protein
MSHVERTARPVRTDLEQTRFDAFDAEVEWLARGLGARGLHYPALISRASLERAGYMESFPHLLLCATPHHGGSTPWCLSPAVCYHVYDQFGGASIDEPMVVTARGACFRGEEETTAGIRQVEFDMREIVFLGPAEWVNAHAATAVARLSTLAGRLGVSGSWYPAEDPFFLPAARGKALLQRLLGVKEEYRPGSADGVALASVNRHGSFFGERFDIRGSDGAPIHTACVALGLDRWFSALTRPERKSDAAHPTTCL